MAEPGARSFEAELHTTSPKLVVAVFLVLAEVLILCGDQLPQPSRAWNLALLLCVLPPISIVLEGKWPRLARWCVVATVIVFIVLVNTWFELPGSLALMAVPTALAAALLGVQPAAVTAATQSLLLLVMVRQGGTGVSPAEAGVAITAIWAVFGVMCAVYRPVYQVAGWSWRQFERARTLLEEARGRSSELKQVLTDLAHANRQLALTNEKLAAARLIAEMAQKAKGEFVASVSHEFRTPLNMIVGLTQFVLSRPDAYGDKLPAALLEDLEIIRRNSEHLASMVNDVLDLSRVGSGRMALQREQVNLCEVIDRALAVVRPLLTKKGLELAVEVPPDLPHVFCDRTRILQVVVNLLSNATRFTERGAITVRVTRDAQHVVVSVADTGPGIPAEEAARLFEPFYQVSGAVQDRGGSGLGLSISKQFVELHDGQMWLESQVGVGSTFHFRLPVFPPLRPLARPERWIAEAWTWVERTSRAPLPVLPPKPRMIACDGSDELYPLVARHTDEVELFAARDLTEAAAELRRCPAEAVLLNVPSQGDLVPQMEQAAVVIRDTPIVGCSLPQRLKRALAAGAVDFLSKPVTHDRLRLALEKIGRPIKRVLVVEDDRDAQQLFARMLRSYDNELNVTIASTGREALEELDNAPPDLILLDIMLPDTDGWKVLEAKRGNGPLCDLPTIIISAHDLQDQPLVSKVFAVTMGDGVSISKLLRCSRVVSALLLQPD